MQTANTGITPPVHAARQASGTGFVYLAAAFAALGGLLFGYDTGVISGAVIFIKRDFALTTFPQELVVSVVLAGAALGALTGGRLADRLGRRLTLLATSIIFILGAILCAAAPSLSVLVIGRAIVGLAIGLACTTVPVYISEVAPPQGARLAGLALSTGDHDWNPVRLPGRLRLCRRRSLAMDAGLGGCAGSNPGTRHAVPAGEPALAGGTRAD